MANIIDHITCSSMNELLYHAEMKMLSDITILNTCHKLILVMGFYLQLVDIVLHVR